MIGADAIWSIVGSIMIILSSIFLCIVYMADHSWRVETLKRSFGTDSSVVDVSTSSAMFCIFALLTFIRTNLPRIILEIFAERGHGCPNIDLVNDI